MLNLLFTCISVNTDEYYEERFPCKNKPLHEMLGNNFVAMLLILTYTELPSGGSCISNGAPSVHIQKSERNKCCDK